MGYTFVIVLVALIREPLAFGTLFGIEILSENFTRWASMGTASGAFFIVGLMIWILRTWAKSYEEE